MSLETARLHLRPVTASDVATLFSIYGDPATNTFNPAGPYPDIQYAETVMNRWLTHWQQNGFGNWAISFRDAPERVIGFGGLSVVTHADITVNNLGYRFATEAWGKGLATEFALGAVKYGFDALTLPEISAVVRSNHLASQKVLEKAGLKYIREIHDVKNAPPSLLYSLRIEAWRKE
ncbi:GNAT family N-acetyltransferase [Enterobacter soli]|uniref:GNAT family N-acetyltransferase n=1 Tax=Enterobacter soli TaxID=885040 RepID=UPI0034CDC9C0